MYLELTRPDLEKPLCITGKRLNKLLGLVNNYITNEMEKTMLTGDSDSQFLMQLYKKEIQKRNLNKIIQ